jgi:transcriptional regulator with XRE-family HTH domain
MLSKHESGPRRPLEVEIMREKHPMEAPNEDQEAAQDISVDVVGSRVRAIRELRSQSLQEIAQAAGLPLDLLDAIEQGKTDPTINQLSKIAAVLDVPMPQLFGELSPAAVIAASLFERAPKDLRNAVKMTLQLQMGDA